MRKNVVDLTLRKRREVCTMTDRRKRWSHLTEENREEIQNGLNMGMAFKSIARRIGADPTTVSKEVKKHQFVREARSEQGKNSQCSQLLKAPFVCNGCRTLRICEKYWRRYVGLQCAQKTRMITRPSSYVIYLFPILSRVT